MSNNKNDLGGCLGLALFIGLFGVGAILVLIVWLIIAAVTGIATLF